MNWKKIFTIAALTGFSASVATGQGTAPTIVQGDYISNVFGQSNFIKNPNAKLNTKDVTVSSATVSRSPTTPLVATSEFNVAVTSANGTITWATRSFDAGMKNQNCEARFTYRGFQSTSKAHVKQGANTVATLNLSATGTDPRIASINFPCGDLSQPTTFVVTDTANMTGTNEIGGIYVGLATNLANVSQAEEAGKYTITGSANCSWTTNSSTFANFSADSDCNTATVTGAATTSAGKIPGATFSNLKPGKYMFVFSGPAFKEGNTIDSVMFRMGDGTTYSNQSWLYAGGANAYYMPLTLVFTTEYTTVTSPTIQLQGRSPTASNNASIYNSDSLYKFEIIAYRFPTSSELVVTPERQNTFGGVNFNGSGFIQSQSITSTSWAKLTYQTNITRNPYGKAFVETNNDISVTIKSLPVGTYRVVANGLMRAIANGSGNMTSCAYGISDSPTPTNPIIASHTNAIGDATSTTQDQYASTAYGVFTNTSLQDKTFYVVSKRIQGAGSCIVGTNSSDYPFVLSVEPLDQPSNSALYVQGPVKAAATGDVTPIGFQNYIVGTTNSSLGVIAGSGGSLRSGTGITLTPGIWEIKVMAQVGNVPPTEIRLGITDTVNGSPLTDSTGFATNMNVDDAGNTCCILWGRTEGIFNVITTKTFYPVVLAYPGGANFNYDFAIRARQLN